MQRALPLILLIAAVAAPAWAETDMIKKSSPYSVMETVTRFEEAIRQRGLKVFPRFDHGAAAEEFSLTMRPAVVVAFGNPKYGTPFMQQNPASGIDFPPKAIIYEDEDGRVWLAYNSSAHLYGTIFPRHGLIANEGDEEFYRQLLEELTDKAVAGP